MVSDNRPHAADAAPWLASPLQILAAVMRRGRFVIGTCAVTLVVALAPPVLAGREYTSEAVILPQASDGQKGSLAGVAAQLGVSISDSDPTHSARFYSEVINGRALLSELAVDTFHFAGRPVPLPEALAVRPHSSPAVSQERTIEKLRTVISVRTSWELQTVRIGVTTNDPKLSQAIAARIITLVNDFNINRRSTVAAAETRFVENRYAEAAVALAGAENSLEAFMRTNRSYMEAPQLRLAHDKLVRDITLKQQLYVTLAQALETARIQQVRNTPTLTIVEAPRAPARPDGRGFLVRGVAGILTGLVAGVFVAVGVELLFRSVRADTRGAAELSIAVAGLRNMRLRRQVDSY
jgi:uncharacterized protein involved in exopolysaccharide biosynthesis